MSGERVEREAYLARLEGMVFGDDPRRGYFLNNTFYNPEFELQFSLPDGWEHARQGTVAQAVHPDRDAVVVVGTIDVESAEEGRAALTAGEGVSELERREASLNGLPALISEFQAETEGGPVRGVGAFVAHEGAVFQILGYARPEAWDRNEAVMRQSVESVSPIQDPERLDVEPRRIQLVRIDQAMSLEEFERRHPSVVPLDTLALMNGLEVDERLPAGTRVKRVTGPESP